MGYQVTQINDLEQFGELSTTFLLVDDEAIMPDVRIEKFFNIESNKPRIIENEKQIDILRVTNEYLKNIEL